MAWKKTEPIEGILAPSLNDVIRDNNDALETALDMWHYFATGGVQTGRPRQGHCRPFFQDAAPTTRLDGNHFDSTDFGTIWIDSNSSPDNQVNILTAADGAGSNTWTPISTEIIAVLLAAAWTFAEVITFTKQPVFSVAVELPDTSAMATSGAPAADAQIANKKYVDDQLAAVLGFSAYATDDTNSQTLAKDHSYLAGTDGFVIVYAELDESDYLYVYVDSTKQNPTTIIGKAVAPTTPAVASADSFSTLIVPVQSGKFFEIASDGPAVTIRWMSVGTLVKPADQD